MDRRPGWTPLLQRSTNRYDNGFKDLLNKIIGKDINKPRMNVIQKQPAQTKPHKELIFDAPKRNPLHTQKRQLIFNAKQRPPQHKQLIFRAPSRDRDIKMLKTLQHNAPSRKH
jgi:hypothetical protein